MSSDTLERREIYKLAAGILVDGSGDGLVDGTGDTLGWDDVYVDALILNAGEKETTLTASKKDTTLTAAKRTAAFTDRRS